MGLREIFSREIKFLFNKVAPFEESHTLQGSNNYLFSRIYVDLGKLSLVI